MWERRTGERLARLVRTTKTVRGKRCKMYYVKIDLPERIAECIEAYSVVIEGDREKTEARLSLPPWPLLGAAPTSSGASSKLILQVLHSS